VHRLYHYLRDRKVDPWLDAEKLLPGQNWKAEIPKALLSSDVIIICLSKNSVDKEGYVQKEIRFALDKALEMPEGRIFLIPARLEECALPESLSTYHYVNLFEEDGYRRLLKSLRVRAQQIGATNVSMGEDTILPEAEKVAREKAEQETAEREAREKAELDAAEKSALEKIEREAAENAAREKTEHDAAEKAKRETKVEPAVKKPVGGKFPAWGIGLIVFAILSLAAWGISLIPSSPVATQTPSATQMSFVEPGTETSVSVTSTTTIDPNGTLGIGSTMLGKDGMTLLYVPAGEFKMGSTDADPLALDGEKPQHTVYLDAFWIDQTEVTNKQYAACVSAGACKLPSDTKSYTRSSYYGNSQFDDYPVIYVDWDQATVYCAWAGRRLPTSAEWEKAARGPSTGSGDGRIYPWGNTAPNKDLLNYNSIVGDTTRVGSYESGKSFYGALDMAGNVLEWVNDWYQSSYYAGLGYNVSNPQGPTSGDQRVLRGGSWSNYYEYVSVVRSAYRYWYLPSNSNLNVGFRCSRSQ
jgi:serine/threonine-protein kinase